MRALLHFNVLREMSGADCFQSPFFRGDPVRPCEVGHVLNGADAGAKRVSDVDIVQQVPRRVGTWSPGGEVPRGSIIRIVAVIARIIIGAVVVRRAARAAAA